MHCVRTWALHFLAFLTILLVAAWPSAAYAQRQSGNVQSGTLSLAGSNVTLYSAGTSRGASATVLGRAVTNRNGDFTINYRSPLSSNAVLYLLADGFLPPRATAPRTEVGWQPSSAWRKAPRPSF